MESIQDILQMMSHISPMTRAALRPVTATAVCVVLLSLAAFSQLPHSLESSRSMMMVISVVTNSKIRLDIEYIRVLNYD